MFQASRRKIAAIRRLLIGGLLFAAAPAAAAPPVDDGVAGWLRSKLGSDESTRSARYAAARADFDGDGKAEAIVYLESESWCGSGGCTLYILRRSAAGWALVNQVSVANLPVRVLASRSHGWSDLGVAVQGGGAGRPREALLSFNGRRYPGNPTVARRAPPEAAGRTVLNETSPRRPVYQ